MRRAALVPVYLVLLAVAAALGAAVQSGRDARERPLDGRWAAEFRLDSARSSFDGDADRLAGRRAAGRLELRTGPSPYPGLNRAALRPTFAGRHGVDFAPLLGQNGSRAPEAVAVRFGPDSALVYLSGFCCHTGGVVGRGRVAGDSVRGVWTTDSDGWAAWGHFTLRRQPGRSASR